MLSGSMIVVICDLPPASGQGGTVLWRKFRRNCVGLLAGCKAAESASNDRYSSTRQRYQVCLENLL